MSIVSAPAEFLVLTTKKATKRLPSTQRKRLFYNEGIPKYKFYMHQTREIMLHVATNQKDCRFLMFVFFYLTPSEVSAASLGSNKRQLFSLGGNSSFPVLQLRYFPSMADKYSHERSAKTKTKHPCQLLRHRRLLSPPSPHHRRTPNTAKQPEVTISWRWLQVNEISHICGFFLIRTMSVAVFLMKPPYGNWFGTKAPLGGWRRSDA